jgi:type II secretory pathway component PulF
VELQEKREALKTQVRAALTYPIILAVVSAFVIVFVLTGVLPKFMPLFEGKESMLPMSTRFLMASSQSLRNFWWAWALGIVGVIAAGTAGLRSPAGHGLRDRLAVSFPVAGRLTNKVLTGQLLRTLGHLLESHVALVDALKVTRLTLHNRFYRSLVDQVEQVVEGGGRLSQAFLAFTYMPATVRQMIATGEDAGNVYPVMLRLAQHYDREIEQELKRVASLIEPIALIVLGGVVGLIVASVILPLFKMAHAIG